jgi:hypothetical protein
MPCVFWEEVPWFIHGCIGDEYLTIGDGPYAQEACTGQARLHQSNAP